MKGLFNQVAYCIKRYETGKPCFLSETPETSIQEKLTIFEDYLKNENGTKLKHKNEDNPKEEDYFKN